MPPVVSQLWIHPVKGCRAVAVDTLELDELGAIGDRRFLITDATGRMLTQRSHPFLAKVVPQLDAATLTLTCDGHGSVGVARSSQKDAPRVTTTVWNDAGLIAEDCGPAAASWLSELAGTSLRLLRIGDDFDRPVKRAPEHRVHAADAYPLLVISESSLALLNDHLIANHAEPVRMERFRPNVVIGGCDAHAEDDWTRFQAGNITLRGMTRCARCIVITTDQRTGARDGAEPLRTLASYRRDPDHPQDVLFGRNVVNESKSGAIRVGDRIVMLPDAS